MGLVLGTDSDSDQTAPFIASCQCVEAAGRGGGGVMWGGNVQCWSLLVVSRQVLAAFLVRNSRRNLTKVSKD